MKFLDYFGGGNVHLAKNCLTHTKNTSRNWRARTLRRTSTTIPSGNSAVGVEDELRANMGAEPWSEEAQDCSMFQKNM
jgi:hypothetical protein